MSANAHQELQITLADIAQLARVQRPVVSMWRSRSKNTSTPFPAAAGVHGHQELFNASDVTDWLAETGRGNNPHAADDAAAFAAPLGPNTKRSHFAGLTAVITLRCLSDAPLGKLSAADLLDSADDHDPDDEFLFSELDALGAHLLPLAAYTDLLTDASYTAAAAFEQLLSDRFHTVPPTQARTMLTAEAVDLLATTAVELAAGSAGPPVFMDDGGSDFLLAVANILGEAAAGVLCVGALNSGPARLARRRMRVHGRHRDTLEVTNAVSASQREHSSSVRLAQFPSPAHPSMDAVEILTAIDNIALDMDSHASAVVIAPAALLTDACRYSRESREADAIRSDVLRSGRVRAIVRLPEKLLPSMPRQAQALWVLGPATAEVPIADRWTMVADLSGWELSADVRQDLVGDLAASMGSREHIRAHSFRFAKLVRTRILLAQSGPLTAAAQTPQLPDPQAQPASAGAAELIRAECLLDSLRETRQAQLPVQLGAESLPAPQPTTVGAALRGGSLKYLPGHRIGEAHREVEELGRAQFTLVGVEELNGDAAFGSRRISQLIFANEYPQGRLTEPGDVIFATGARGGAVVDAEGAAVVLYPARILRINAQRAGGLVSEILAQDLRVGPPGSWRQWPVRRIDPRARPGLSAALNAVAQERRRLAVRLQQLDELSGLLMDGAARGSFQIVDVGMTMEGTG